MTENIQFYNIFFNLSKTKISIFVLFAGKNKNIFDMISQIYDYF